MTVLSVLFFFSSSAQSNISSQKRLNIYNIIKVQNSAERTTRDLIIGPEQIEKLELLSKPDAEKAYSSIKADMFFVVIPKADVKFFNKTQLFNLYKVDGKYRNLPVLIDGEQSTDSESLLAANGTISKVLVNQESGFIDIITVFHKNHIDLKKRAIESKEQRLKEIQEKQKKRN
ncbi:hypothetical protein [Pseudopedobacter beijingensis]|uniref:Uncharacterized protein n=1 Tax=Pseudopedobacter beijingensis TaxID=1207056 RepID=A0ABW4I7W6_9SPHI